MKRTMFVAVGCVATLFASSKVFAGPTGGTVVGGGANATISGEGTTLTTINQTANRAIINWQDFSIGAGEVTRFIQPSSSASVLNRVIGINPTEIFGLLQANGHVLVINANGILVSRSGVIDTRGFTASTLDVPNHSFMSPASLTFS